MPYQANTARRHQFPKAKYQVKNWGEYDQAWQSNRVGHPEALAAWQAPPTGRRGRSPYDSNLAIETGHLLHLAFGRSWRPTEDLLRSIMTLQGGELGGSRPHHVFPTERDLVAPHEANAEQRTGHVVIDSTGLKIYGAGEWHREKHGERGHRKLSGLAVHAPKLSFSESAPLSPFSFF